MNCRAAQRLLSAERDGALAPRERASLDGHVAACAACRQFRATLTEAAASFRTTAARMTVPEAERAWQDIHREIRTTRPSGARVGWAPVRWALPLGAAAALAAVMTLMPQDSEREAPAMVAHAEFVEVPGDASSVVYVDDQSGWLVVWAADSVAKVD